MNCYCIDQIFKNKHFFSLVILIIRNGISLRSLEKKSMLKGGYQNEILTKKENNKLIII